jgi:hypothetical protein
MTTKDDDAEAGDDKKSDDERPAPIIPLGTVRKRSRGPVKRSEWRWPGSKAKGGKKKGGKKR